MSLSVEIKLDYDRSVSTEDRFAIRKWMDSFVEAVNKCEPDLYRNFVSDGSVMEGFSDIPQVKQGFITMLTRRFKGDGTNLMRFPELKLSSNRFMFHLDGTYEEYTEGILVTEGTIEISIIKVGDSYQFTKIVFFPRMMLKDENL